MKRTLRLSSIFVFLIVILSIILAGCNIENENTEENKFLNSQESVTSDEIDIVAFKNVNIITMIDNKILENRTVLIKDGIISEIGEYENIIIPKDAQIIDGEGKFLMPGLTDMHVHLHRYRAEEPLYLLNGVTSVQNMWGRPEILRAREFNNRRKTGIRIFTTSPIMDGENPIWQGSLVVDTPEKARDEVIRAKEIGYDSIKVYELLTLDVYEEIIKTARDIGFRVVGHVPREVGIEKAIELGQDSIEHLSGYSETDIENQAFLTAENMVWNTPTLAIIHIVTDENEIEGLEYINPKTIEMWRKITNELNYKIDLKRQQTIVSVIHEKGGKLLAGTDANNPFVVPGFSMHSELRYLVEAGLTPYEALKAATYNPAKFLGMLDKLGTVEVGKEADLILLSKNPFEDINNIKTIEGTMVWGKWMDKNSLLNDLERIKGSY